MKSVFISSTFKDMQAERDLLHEKIFPRLRRVIGKYGEDIQELDLRWGVDTMSMSEEESGHLVLQVCIDAIDRCRPFIIVLLGERYGWIPDEELVENMRDARIDTWYEPQMSITNLEIKYGALSEEETLKKCVFCFRDPSVIGQIDEEYRGIYAAESPAHGRKLDALKQQIRQKEQAVILDYTSQWDPEACGITGLEAFGEELYRILVQMIEKEFAGRRARHPMEQLTLDMERMREQYLSSYVRRYEEELALTCQVAFYHSLMRSSVSRELAMHRERRFLTGGAGSGKSAVMASVSRLIQDAGGEVILYFAGLPGCQNTDTLKDYVLWRLEEIAGLPHGNAGRKTEEIRENTEADREDRLRILSEKISGTPVYCVIDGLDQMFRDGEQVYFDLMGLCPNLYFILSALPEFPVDQARRGCIWQFEVCRMGELDEDQRREIIRCTSAKRGKKLDDEITELTVREPGARNPLFLSMLLQRYFMMDQREFRAAEAMEPGMDGLHQYMRRLLDEMPDEPEAMASYLLYVLGERFALRDFSLILQLLAVSRFGLTETELEEILRLSGYSFSVIGFQQAVSYLYDAFAVRADGKWTFAHRLFSEAVLRQMTKEDERRAKCMLIDYSGENPEFLRREGFYYIFDERHPMGSEVFLAAADWTDRQNLLDQISMLLKSGQEYRDYFLEITKMAEADAAALVWGYFDMYDYGADAQDFLAHLMRELFENEAVSVKQKCNCAITLSDYFSKKQEAESGYRYLERAEKLCEKLPEPERSMYVSSLIFKKAEHEIYLKAGETDAWVWMEQAAAMLSPWMASGSREEQRKVLLWDTDIKLCWSDRSGYYRRDYLPDLLEECLARLNACDVSEETEETKNEIQKWKIRILVNLGKAWQVRGHWDSNRAKIYENKARDLAGVLVEKSPSRENLSLLRQVLNVCAARYKGAWKYPYFEEKQQVTRRIYAGHPSDYWKMMLANDICLFALYAEWALMKRSKSFPDMDSLLKRAKECWQEGLALFEEILSTCDSRDIIVDACTYYLWLLGEKAHVDREQGYLKQALTEAGQAQELLRNRKEFLYFRSREAEGRQRCRILALQAETLDDMNCFSEALPFAKENAEMEVCLAESQGKTFQLAAEAQLLTARILYHLRRDDEALDQSETAREYFDRCPEQDGEKLSEFYAELDYIQGRIFFEKGDYDRTAERIGQLDAYWERKADGQAWNLITSQDDAYGQYLTLRADLMNVPFAVDGVGDFADESALEELSKAWSTAIGFWNNRKKDEEKAIRTIESFTVSEEKGKIQRKIYSRDSARYMRAAYYERYCLLHKAQGTGDWDNLNGYKQVMELGSVKFLDEFVLVPYAQDVFGRLDAAFAEQLSQINWWKVKIPDELRQKEITVCDSIGQFAGYLEENPPVKDDYIQSENVVFICGMIGKNRENLRQWAADEECLHRIYTAAKSLYRAINAWVEKYRYQQELAEKTGRRYHLSESDVRRLPYPTKEERKWIGDTDRLQEELCIPLLSLCAWIENSCPETSEASVKKNLKTIARNILFLFDERVYDVGAGRYIKKQSRDVWNISKMSSEMIRFLLNAIQKEDECKAEPFFRHPKNLLAAELYMRERDENIIQKRLREMTEISKFCQNKRWLGTTREKTRKEWVDAIWMLFRELIRRDGSVWIAKYMDYMKEHPEYAKMLPDYGDVLWQEAQPYLAELDDLAAEVKALYREKRTEQIRLKL